MGTVADVSAGYDDASFERQTVPWIDDVYRFALSLTRNEADAEDLLQETYFRAYRSWHTFRPGSNALSWLFAICRNWHLRVAPQNRRWVHLENGDAEVVAHSEEWRQRTLGVEEQTIQRDLVASVYDAIDRLREPFRSTVMLVDVEDQTYAEAAMICRVPVGTIRSRLFRARRLIRAMIRPAVRAEMRSAS
jgi:RNA polymerase sigma-70 factor, ECF subfamily